MLLSVGLAPGVVLAPASAAVALGAGLAPSVAVGAGSVAAAVAATIVAGAAVAALGVGVGVALQATTISATTAQPKKLPDFIDPPSFTQQYGPRSRRHGTAQRGMAGDVVRIARRARIGGQDGLPPGSRRRAGNDQRRLA